MNLRSLTHRHLWLISGLLGLQVSTAFCAEDLPYNLEYSRDALIFQRANTREQDFGVALRVTGPNDFQFQQSFTPGQLVYFPVLNQRGQLIGDGQYNFELSLLAATRSREQTPLISDPNKFASTRQSGVFSVQSGFLVNPDASETGGTRDTTIVDDFVVQGSICAGTDCVNGENFDFDTIRLKENNLRIRFFDTSNSSSFPSADWELVANDTTNGGANRFSIEDITSGVIPFTVEGATPNHSLYVDSSGRVGFGTSTPLLGQL